MLCKVYTLHCTGNIPLIKLTKKYVLKEYPWNIHQEPFIFVYTYLKTIRWVSSLTSEPEIQESMVELPIFIFGVYRLL